MLILGRPAMQNSTSRTVLRGLASLTVLLSLGLWVTPAHAQYRFDYWTTDNGLPQNQVSAITQTPDGYLWLATNDGLVRYDGVRFGHRCKDPKDLLDLYKRTRGEGFGAEVKRRIMTGTYVLSAGYYDAYYLKAQKVRSLINADFRRAFGQVDVLMGPTAPTPAFAIGAKTDDPILMYLNDIYTIGANLAGLPAMSIPCGFQDGLPVGLQIIGPHFAEAKLLNVGHGYQRETTWHERIPKGYE